jgi:serine phosphatase RsbU (regulator of sigma subunit)
VVLQPGQRLVLYTDGISEARSPDGQFLGAEGIVHILDRHAGEALRPFCAHVVAEVAAYQQHELRDDVTMVVLQRNR